MRSADDARSSRHVPRHVAVIMDGNGRWAVARGLPRAAGHKKGAERLREMAETCGEKGIRWLTLFAFSSENWRRPHQEVRFLISLFQQALGREVERLHRNNVRFRVIGDVDRFGPGIVKRVREAERLTAGNTGLTLTIAANYGGRWDVVQAVKSLTQDVLSGRVAADAVTEEEVSRRLCLADAPEPDLFIRTGGEQRISNFLLWQLAYSELWFTELPWPDFGREAFERALEDFGSRERRYGQTREQLASRRASALVESGG